MRVCVPSRHVWLALVVAWQCGPQRALAQAVNVEERLLAAPDEVDRATQGFKMALAAGVFYPSPQDRAGVSLGGDVLYDVRLGSVVLAPGLRVTGYFTKDFTGLGAFGTFSAGLRLGPVLPFLIGGVGGGYASEPEEWGVAYLGGAGVLLIFRKRLAFGAEASYQGFALTEFEAANVALTMQFAY
jgi:hypothetical protein